MNNVGSSANAPILIPAASKTAVARPIQLSREKTEKLFSGKDRLIMIELKNRKKQVMPAKADKAVTGLGK